MATERKKTKGAMLGGALAAVILLCLAGVAAGRAQATSEAYEVEYYYKAQWGHADEWLALFKKNHLPVLKALKEQGRIVDIEMERPRYHATEDGRWDYRVTITWKNAAASMDSSGEQAVIRNLFPDQERFKREEQRRFEILLAHWDLPIVEVEAGP